MLEEELLCQRDELLTTFKRKKFPPTRRHNDDLMSMRNKRRNGKEYSGEMPRGVVSEVGQGVVFFFMILQIFWNVVKFYS